jgi:hypothetical protein
MIARQLTTGDKGSWYMSGSRSELAQIIDLATNMETWAGRSRLVNGHEWVWRLFPSQSKLLLLEDEDMCSVCDHPKMICQGHAVCPNCDASFIADDDYICNGCRAVLNSLA